MTDDVFGFSDATKKPDRTTSDKLKSIRPEPTSAEPLPLDRVDAAADAHGFHSREGVRIQVKRRKRDLGPTIALNTRAPERIATPFIQFCEDNRFSYWEGIEELMKRAKLL